MPLYSREAAPETQRPEFAYAARSLNRTLVTTEGAMLEELLSRTAPAGQLPRAELARHLQLCHLAPALTLTLALALILTLAPALTRRATCSSVMARTTGSSRCDSRRSRRRRRWPRRK